MRRKRLTRGAVDSAVHTANSEGLENKLLEEIRKVQSDDDLKRVGQKRVYGRTVNHAVDVPVSQIREKTGDMVQAMQRSTQQHVSSQAVASNNCKQHNKRERKKERKGVGERGQVEKEKGQEERERGERGKREKETEEQGKGVQEETDQEGRDGLGGSQEEDQKEESQDGPAIRQGGWR